MHVTETNRQTKVVAKKQTHRQIKNETFAKIYIILKLSLKKK